MKPICSICGRRTQPFAYLGNEVLGPQCARRLGLTPAKAGKTPKSGRLRFAGRGARVAAPDVPVTIDLFPETL